MVYKFTPLAEYSSYWKCSIGLIGYIMTQVFKLLFVSSIIIPPLPVDIAIDCLGFYYLLTKQHKASLPEVKILSVAVGWSFGESLLTRFIDFYINARSMQFDWKHLFVAAEANIALVQNVCICTLLLMNSRHSSKNSKAPLMVILGYLVLVSFVSQSIVFKGLLAAALGVSTVMIYN
ncbi:Transmembrane protein [Halotydeus destructor]|nr:Transmembrane protein [Halotydeus destructor]